MEAYIQANSLVSRNHVTNGTIGTLYSRLAIVKASGDLGAKRDRAIVQRIEKIEIIRDDLSMGASQWHGGLTHIYLQLLNAQSFRFAYSSDLP